MEQQMRPGSISWCELLTSDVSAARDFYSKLFGWEMRDFEGAMPYTIVKAAGQDMAGIMAMPKEAAGMQPY